MSVRTPLTLITGPLGSGKTTLLRHMLAIVPQKRAILMNEFGEIAIDAKILQGKNVQMADLGGGCVCCSLLGEFEAAVDEIIGTVNPDVIVVETTGVAEPDAIVFDIQESLPQVRLDGVITLADADALVQYPRLGHTTTLQIEAADAIILNKIDLVDPAGLVQAEQKLQAVNPAASIIRAVRCQVDPDLLFGIGRAKIQAPPHHVHQPEFESFSFTSSARFDRACFESFANNLEPDVYRAKGFIQLADATYLFNFVTGRWDLEPFEPNTTELVFIGKQITEQKTHILDRLQSCQQ